MSKQYNGDWALIQGSLKAERINKLPECLEKDHLFEVRNMLSQEGFQPDFFFVEEYPIEGVYICCNHRSENYFRVEWDDNLNRLTPTYATRKYDENGYNCFNCETIEESIALTEWLEEEAE